MKENTTTTRKDFNEVKRNFERAYASGEYAVELAELAEAIAHSVLNTCIDPQRKTAAKNQEKWTWGGAEETARKGRKTSNGGNNPALVSVKRSISKDLELLEETVNTINAATRIRFTQDGDPAQEVVNETAQDAVKHLISRSLGDGLDVVHDAILGLLEQAKEHAAADAWLDAVYTIHCLNRKVLIREEESAAWHDEETTPIQQAYGETRHGIERSRAMQTDPRNGYSYIEEVYKDEDGEETTCHRRLPLHFDLGGYISSSFNGEDFGGAYSVSEYALMEYNSAIARLNLTDRQAEYVKFRMRGCGYDAIASRFGVKKTTVTATLSRLAERCEKMGFTPTAKLAARLAQEAKEAEEDAYIPAPAPIVRKVGNGTAVQWTETAKKYEKRRMSAEELAAFLAKSREQNKRK